MRLFVLTLATAAMCFVASTAAAVDFSIIGADSATVNVGDSFTIDILVTNTAGTELAGLGASVSEYGANEFDSGAAVSSYLNAVCVSPGICFGGLLNLAGGALEESAIGGFGDRVQIALSAGLSTVANDGSIDQGIDGVVGTTQFSLTFTAAESADILIGTSYQGDGVILGDGTSIQAQGATFSLNVIPEPGTALLMGLGLAGLASAGRRE